jgi:GT2 family glycosyltransferase
LVSVVIPAYAAAPYIRQTLDSVFAQTYPHFEVIVVNDGSPDTEQFETAIAPYAKRIVYLKQANRGPSVARNAGVLRAQGEFIAFLDSDDTWLPVYLEQQLQALGHGAGYDFIYCDAMLLLEDKPSGQTFMQGSASRGPVTFDSLLSLDCIVILSCTVVRREVLVKAGLFDERFWHCEDFDLWLRTAFAGARMTFQREVLACHRLRKGSLSASAQSMREARKQVYEKTIAALALNETQRSVASQMLRHWSARIELENGKRLLIERDYANARSRLRAANSYFHSGKISALIALLAVAPAPAHRLYDVYLRKLSSRSQNANTAPSLISPVADLKDFFHADSADLNSAGPDLSHPDSSGAHRAKPDLPKSDLPNPDLSNL